MKGSIKPLNHDETYHWNEIYKDKAIPPNQPTNQPTKPRKWSNKSTRLSHPSPAPAAQIFCSFSPLMTGLAFAICSLPILLKSNPQACCSGYLCVPQNVIPHLHLNLINLTRRLHVVHLFGWLSAEGTASSFFSSSFTFVSSTITRSTLGKNGEDEEEEKAWEAAAEVEIKV